MTSEGLGEMFEGDSADTCARKFLVCADPGARTPSALAEILVVVAAVVTSISSSEKDDSLRFPGLALL